MSILLKKSRLAGGIDVLNCGEPNVCLVCKTKLIRISGPQELLAVQNLLFVPQSLWFGDLRVSDGLL